MTNSALQQVDDPFLRHHLPGESEPMAELRRQIAMLNHTINRDLVRNVLIMGESGAGKNYTASVVAGHRQWLLEAASSQAEPPQGALPSMPGTYVELSLPGLPDQLVESELFGHRKGAFTGAARDHTGYLAQGYTDLLLDEVGDISLPFQAKLLRVLNSGEYRPVGGGPEDEARTDARLLLATNRNLRERCAAGLFREDLLWRVGEFVLSVPPLREQKDAIQQIMQNVLVQIFDARGIARPDGSDALPEFDDSDLRFASEYDWPGNVRQLRHALSRWLISQGGKSVQCCAVELEHQLVRTSRDGADIRGQIMSLLDASMEEGVSAAETASEFVETYFSGPAREAVAEWLATRSPRPPALTQLFPGHRDANAIRSTIRKWGVKR